jgi:hyperosmotically inducible protein
MAKRLMGISRLLPCLLILGGFAQAGTGSSTEVNNTKVNERDAQMDTLTAQDQSKGSASDVELTRKIRQSVIADKALSTDAHNVKIVTINHVVTLRGPVSSASEKRKIDALSKRISGVTRVDNQLEIKTRAE